MSNKYSNILTMVLIVIIVAIVGICFYYGYDYYTQEAGEEQTQKSVEKFNNTVRNKVVVANKKPKTNTTEEKVPENITDFNSLYENHINTAKNIIPSWYIISIYPLCANLSIGKLLYNVPSGICDIDPNPWPMNILFKLSKVFSK